MKEKERLDKSLAKSIDVQTRMQIWRSTEAILSHGPTEGQSSQSTVLALGYVQSGKTTSMTALAANAADLGYNVIIALLGSTNLLLDQNKSRLEKSLGIGERADYVWVSESNPSTDSAGKRLRDFVDRGRVCIVPLLKHAGRIRSAAKQLAKLPDDLRVLIIDDEADQASLNTGGQATESRTYAAIKDLRKAVPTHLYVQYTATPYAPLMLDAADILSPEAVEFLVPGRNYTGGKEFFIDHAKTVVRNVPMLDEQASRTPPLQLQSSLCDALAAFIAGATVLLLHDQTSPPISMLVHSTARNDVQARYEFLIRRQIAQWRTAISGSVGDIPLIIEQERQRLVQNGIGNVDDSIFVEKLKFVLAESTTWLVNSAADIDKVDWNVAPIHILVGGNKLDRGFTVEGLTVTYMNRPASSQVDTMEQRARAFGYRGDLLPYCQFFASKRTVRSLTEIVHTEADLRARLRDHIDRGGSVRTWAKEIGLLLPADMTPTRASVVQALTTMELGWHVMRKPSISSAANRENRELLEHIGLMDAPLQSHGRLRFRTLELGDVNPLLELFSKWIRSDYSPGWLHDEFVDALARNFSQIRRATVMLMEENGNPRVRKWDPDIGFVNLFQGRDLRRQPNGDFYPGDRNVLSLEENPKQIVLQIHRNVLRDLDPSNEVFALAAHLGGGLMMRKDANA